MGRALVLAGKMFELNTPHRAGPPGPVRILPGIVFGKILTAGFTVSFQNLVAPANDSNSIKTIIRHKPTSG